MGRWHAYFAARKAAEVAAVVDPRPEAALALRKHYPGARSFDELTQCLREVAVEVVHVCTGAATHRHLAEAALLAGKHVLVEKPLAPSLRETEELLALAQGQRLRLGVVHQFPFQRGFRGLRRNLSRIGSLVRIGFTVCSAGGEGQSMNERQRILLEMLPHPVSLFSALLDKTFARCQWSVVRFTGDDLDLTGILDGLLLEVFISLRG